MRALVLLLAGCVAAPPAVSEIPASPSERKLGITSLKVSGLDTDSIDEEILPDGGHFQLRRSRDGFIARLNESELRWPGPVEDASPRMRALLADHAIHGRFPVDGYVECGVQCDACTRLRSCNLCFACVAAAR